MHDKVRVHGHGPWQGAASPKLEKPPTSQDGGLALLGLVVRPTVTSPLERSGRLSPYHQSGNPCSSFAWRRFVDCFIHGNGNDNAVVTPRGAQSPCALCRRDRASFVGKETREAGASPSLLARLGEPGHLTTLGEAGSLAELRVAPEASSRGRFGRHPQSC